MRDLRQTLTRLTDVVGQKKTDSWRKKDSDLKRQLSKRRIVDVCCAVTAAYACLAFWFSSTHYHQPLSTSQWDPNSRMSIPLVSPAYVHRSSRLSIARSQRSARLKQSVSDRSTPIVSLLVSLISVSHRSTQQQSHPTGHLWKGGQDRHPHHRQEEVPGALCVLSPFMELGIDLWQGFSRILPLANSFMLFGSVSSLHLRRPSSFL